MAASPWTWTNRVLFLVVCVAWGFNYLFVTAGLADASPLWLATLRASIGAIGILAITLALGRWGTLDARGRRDALLLGLPNTALFFGLWFVAARSVPSGIAAVIIYTFPLWVALLSSPVLGHVLGWRQWVAVGVGFVGVVLLSEIGTGQSTAVGLVPVLELLGAAIAWATGTVLFQRRFHRDEMAEASAFQLIGGSIALLVATLVLAPFPLPNFTPTLWASVLWLGLLGTAVAYTIWFHLLGRVRAATLSAYVFLVPVVALLGSAVFYGERLAPLQFVGVALVLVSIWGIARTPEPVVEPRARPARSG